MKNHHKIVPCASNNFFIITAMIGINDNAAFFTLVPRHLCTVECTATPLSSE